MTFTCPHLDLNGKDCLKLTDPCDPGRKGCEVQKKAWFPAKEGNQAFSVDFSLKDELRREFSSRKGQD
ncbi:MAG: hypothetical protein L6Q77_09550 [Bacteroidetes bacterium]|nr:hypothetical protein [Bacteroidota bacterium]